jgi:Na+/H+-dicarboxylate symporter
VKTDTVRVLLALVVATALGLLIAAANDARLIALADQLVPIGTLWVNAIRMTVIPLVVSLLVTGVASTTDVAAIGRLGARTMIVFVLLSAGMAVVMMPIIAAVFAWLPPAASRPPMPPGASEAASQVVASEAPTLAAWLTSLIPSNPVSAAADGAMVPLIIFTLLFALALTRVAAPARTTLLSLFQAVAETMLMLVGWVILAAPIGIFALILPLAAHAGSALVGGIGFYIVAYSALSVVATLLLYPATAIFGGVSIKRFARAALAPQLIAFSSSSSIASLPALVASAETELRLPKRTTGFVLPLAVSTLKVAGPVSWTVGALFIGWFYGIPLGLRELATVAFAAVFLAFAAPGVPRGAFIMLTPLLLAVGLPAEGVGILIAVDALPDVFATVLNVTGDLAAAVIVGRPSAAAEPVVDSSGWTEAIETGSERQDAPKESTPYGSLNASSSPE